MLQRAGIEVASVAGTAPELVRLTDATAPDVVITDIRMPPDHALTPRQGEVLALIAEGRSNAAIARRLVIIEKAVVQHISHIYEQLGLAPTQDDHRRVLAVIRYLAR